MLRNYVTDTDLKSHYPGLSKQLWSGSSSYAVQIAESYDHLQNDLYNKGINPRLCMIPLDLNGPTTALAGGPPAIVSQSAGVVGNQIAGNNERRLVLSVIANSGSNTIKVQGSNDPQSTPAAATWVDVVGASITVSGSGSQTLTAQFQDQYRWYRYSSTISGACQYSVSLVEVIFDHAIVMGAFKLIFRDFIVDPGDVWNSRYDTASLEYDRLCEQIKFGYDFNDDGTLEGGEDERAGQIIFSR